MLDNIQYEQPPVEENQNTESKSKRSGCVAFIVDTLETILLALVLYLAIDALTERVRVENISMLPTLREGNFLLVNKVSYKLSEPSIGDVVVFHAPGQDEQDYIKRIIGLPGDEVRIADGIVYVNDQPLYEPYIADPPNYTGNWVVPASEYFVLGDNRIHSSDSHLWGFVPREDIVGRALLVYWPFDEIKLLRSPEVVQAVQ